MPVLIPAVDLTTLAAAGGAWADARGDLVLLAAYAGLLVSASFVLFDYVWRD